MDIQRLLITERKDYEEQLNTVDSVVNRFSNLPKNPFVGDGFRYQFDEFDWTLSGDFWGIVCHLANEANDSEVLMAVLSPDPVDYFNGSFGHYQWGRLPASMTSQGYWEFINQSPQSSPADSILVVAEKIAWVPPSNRWAIWGDRASGLCVIATKSIPLDVNCNGIDWALEWCRPWATASYLQQLELSFGDN